MADMTMGGGEAPETVANTPNVPASNAPEIPEGSAGEPGEGVDRFLQ